MSATTTISPDSPSLEEKPFPFLNTLDSLEQFLTMHHTKKAQTPMDAKTLPKLETMIITETLTKGNDEDAHRKFTKFIRKVLWQLKFFFKEFDHFLPHFFLVYN